LVVHGEDEEEDELENEVGRRVPSSLYAHPRDTIHAFALN
jgi:hypothetical protein